MVLQITKEQRKELQEVLDSLVEEGKDFSFQAWKVQQGSDEKNHGNIPSEHPWIWICYGRRTGRRYLYSWENVNGAFRG